MKKQTQQTTKILITLIEIIGITAAINAFMYCFVYINILSNSESMKEVSAKLKLMSTLLPKEWYKITEIVFVVVIFLTILFIFTNLIREKIYKLK